MRKQTCLQIIILIIWAAASSATPLKNVVIISIDALHPAAPGAGVTPTIHGVMTAGAYTLDGHSTNPPKTLIAHTAMFTGLGPEYGWLSPEYMEELSYIDEYLTPLIRMVKEQMNYVIIITSDHGGHGKIHGSQHPEDFRLPFIAHSDIMKLKDIQDTRYSVTDLKGLVDRILN